CGCYPDRISSLKRTLFFWQPDVDPEGKSYLGTAKASLDDLSPSSDFSGSYDPMIGVLSVRTTPDRTIPADTDFVFSFSGYLLRNPEDIPAIGVKYPSVTVTSGGNILLPSQEMDSGIMGGKGRAAFSRFLISESSEVVGAFSRITVEFESNFPITSLQGTGARILIAGLLDYQTQAGKVPLDGANSHHVSRYAFGNWSPATGLMTFSGGVTTGSCGSVRADRCALKPGTMDFSVSRYTFSFVLKNTYKVDAGGNFPRIYMESDEVSAPQYQTPSNATGNSAAWEPRPAGFSLAQVAESTTVQNTRNTLTITLRATMRLEPGSTVTISGLVGSTTSDGAVSLAGADAGLFQGAVQTGAAYLVTLTVADGQVVLPLTDVVVSFPVGNPSSAQPSHTIQLTGTARAPAVAGVCPSTNFVPSYGPDVPLTPRDASGGVLSAADPLIFTTKIIHESTRVNRAINTITVTLMPRSTIPEGATITLTPLATPLSTVNALPIAGRDAHLVNFVGAFQTGVLTLTLRPGASVPAGHTAVFSFLLNNPNCAEGGCVAVPTMIRASGNLLSPLLEFEEQEMDSTVRSPNS
ncbi:hypothetical protein T484DRAFT_1841570, partial [Baffinella frigidus]